MDVDITVSMTQGLQRNSRLHDAEAERRNVLTNGSWPSPSMPSSVLNAFCVKEISASVNKVFSLSIVYGFVCACMSVAMTSIFKCYST